MKIDLAACVRCHGCTDGYGMGSFVAPCKSGALRWSFSGGCPEIDADKCVDCGACVEACPVGAISR